MMLVGRRWVPFRSICPRMPSPFVLLQEYPSGLSLFTSLGSDLLRNNAGTSHPIRSTRQHQRDGFLCRERGRAQLDA